jgi:hypothetical protein
MRQNTCDKAIEFQFPHLTRPHAVQDSIQMMMCSAVEAYMRGSRSKKNSHHLRLNTKLVTLHPSQLPSDLASQFARSSSGIGGQTWVVSNVSARKGCVHLFLELTRVGATPLDNSDESGREAAHALGRWITSSGLLTDPSSGKPFRGVLNVQVC